MNDYTLTKSTCTINEMELTIHPCDDTRGADLARAMRGRFARARGVWYMTPARAKKWELLYGAGFRIVDCNARKGKAQKFTHPNHRRKLTLQDASTCAQIMKGTK